jgi:hypothetical protein
MPIIVDNDEEVFKTAVASSINIDYENPRIIVINNSLEIEDILISEVMIREATFSLSGIYSNVPSLITGRCACLPSSISILPPTVFV